MVGEWAPGASAVGAVGAVGGEWWALGLGAGLGLGVAPLWPHDEPAAAFRALLHR